MRVHFQELAIVDDHIQVTGQRFHIGLQGRALPANPARHLALLPRTVRGKPRRVNVSPMLFTSSVKSKLDRGRARAPPNADQAPVALNCASGAPA